MYQSCMPIHGSSAKSVLTFESQAQRHSSPKSQEIVFQIDISREILRPTEGLRMTVLEAPVSIIPTIQSRPPMTMP